jgi:hypothetical protein
MLGRQKYLAEPTEAIAAHVWCVLVSVPLLPKGLAKILECSPPLAALPVLPEPHAVMVAESRPSAWQPPRRRSNNPIDHRCGTYPLADGLCGRTAAAHRDRNPSWSTDPVDRPWPGISRRTIGHAPDLPASAGRSTVRAAYTPLLHLSANVTSPITDGHPYTARGVRRASARFSSGDGGR